MTNGTMKNQRFYISIIFPAIVLLVILFFLIPIDPGVKGSSSSKTPQMKKLAVNIGRLEAEIHEKQDELIRLSKLYSDQTGELLPVLKGLEFSEGERKILEDKIIKEQDVSIKSLLKDILEKSHEISRLKNEIAKSEALLPKAHIVSEGESHYQISMDFLIKEKKVEIEVAARLLEETILFAPLISGFKVWNFYAGDEFGTFVTQGNAEISPIQLRREPGKYSGFIKSAAIAVEEGLTFRIRKLKSEKDQLESQIENLRKEKEAMIQKLSDLSRRNKEMQTELNSLFYMVDLEANLLKRGIIKTVFLGLGSPKLKKISLEDYDQSIDLRVKRTIEILAGRFNLSKLKRVSLYPGFYKRDVDYNVKFEEDKRKAVLEILSIEKFKNERVIISIE